MFVFADQIQDQQVRALIAVTERDFESWFQGLSEHEKTWVGQNRFRGESGRWLAIPSTSGGVEKVVCGYSTASSLWALAGLPRVIPSGIYRLSSFSQSLNLSQAMLGFGLGCYEFSRYKSQQDNSRSNLRTANISQLLLEGPSHDSEQILAHIDAVSMVRDLVNTPANDLGPSELADIVFNLADRHQATATVIDGGCLEKEFPAIATVGQAAARAPRLIKLTWGPEDAPALALVGKGVIFDSGGLSIKPNSGMALMKKDMGGAAHVIALASLIMKMGLRVNLRVYIPAVENAISGNAYRPSDIIRTRSGKSVEIGNTDAEGRLILADALTLACEEGAQRVIDFATLTGAARVALGEDLPPIYCRDQQQARAIQDLSFECEDPLWPMPLFDPYRTHIKPQIADLSNTGSGQFAGSVTAALFLDEFVSSDKDWMHLDVYAWNPTNRPGRPVGGEAQGLRSIWSWLVNEYGLLSS